MDCFQIVLLLCVCLLNYLRSTAGAVKPQFQIADSEGAALRLPPRKKRADPRATQIYRRDPEPHDMNGRDSWITNLTIGGQQVIKTTQVR